MTTAIINNINSAFGNDFALLSDLITILLMIFLLSLYEFFIYRIVTRRTMYNKAFHTTIMILPFFVGMIVASLQSNLILTLGTIGALAIIRFRTAVKDPIDMMYILWSIYIGISCGCGLYESCILTSIVVTIVLLIINLLSTTLYKNPYILVVNSSKENEDELNKIIKELSSSYRLKSRNFTSHGVDYVYQVNTKKTKDIASEIKKLESVKQFSVLEFDNDDAM